MTLDSEGLLDDIDRRMAAVHRDQPRMPVADLARLVGLSGSSAEDRLRRLEHTGILSSRADVDPGAVGYTMHVMVSVRPVGAGFGLIPGIARELPSVTECYWVTGEDCYFMKVWLRSIGEMKPLLDQFKPQGRTAASIVNSSPVPPRPLPLTPF